MMVPDFVMIPQIHLSARVFTNPFTLARKIDAPSTLSMSQRSHRTTSSTSLITYLQSEDSKTRLAKLHYLIPSFIPPKSLSSVPPFHTLHFTPLTVDLTDARNIVFQIRFFCRRSRTSSCQ
ncbi:hypothetical protein BLNAU_8655 [Blattamonas nauphoetae]|uniref:Uncharacterized protein n=1 Tax=Blattamonas nauphoetae TaxID=2049346 RepID=A0ABQ9XY59_9EUKA|nr:hypothetical protein BLNAU_8655 [Blattamonas nauphoetae]